MRSFSGICCAGIALARIIGAPLAAALLALGLTGCSTLKLAYNNLPELAYWWLDGYVSFESSQTPRVRNELSKLQEWHRRKELPEWIALLQKAQAQALQDTTAAQVCELGEALRARLLALSDAAEPAIADLALSLTPGQIDHIEKKFGRQNADYRSDWLDKSRSAQQERRYDQWLDRSEDFYGDLDDTQKKALRRMVSDSVFNPGLFDTERKRRQAMVLTSLRTLVANPGTSPAEARRAIHAYSQTVASPPPGRWREQQQAVWEEGCRNVATLHNMTTPVQREEAVRHLRDYEAQLRDLAIHAQ